MADRRTGLTGWEPGELGDVHINVRLDGFGREGHGQFRGGTGFLADRALLTGLLHLLLRQVLGKLRLSVRPDTVLR